MQALPKDRRRKVFERVVNPLLVKHLETYKGTFKGSCIASNIPIKYLSYFKEVSASRRAKKVRYRYRGCSKPGYKRPQSFCHMFGADTFSLYYR
jgi:hypothetical protein|tara:strand:- start:2593 stop:2874 length:282 start_codon:yes stop_codon:yes gene_type:complete